MIKKKEAKIKVGIIEDDPMVLQINRKYTERVKGFVVKKEINLNKGMNFEIKSLKKLDLILLDIFLPKKNGIEILKEIRDLNINIDVIIISASKDVEHIDKCMKLGIIDYLIKPFTLERFKKSLFRYLNISNKLNIVNELKQDELDDLINRKNTLDEKDSKNIFPNKNDILPKGLSRTTLDKITRCLIKNSQKQLSSYKIAEKIGVSRVTAQRYLNYLEEEGVIELEINYGTVGRPKHLYIFKN